jgi:hypothetical protein
VEGMKIYPRCGRYPETSTTIYPRFGRYPETSTTIYPRCGRYPETSTTAISRNINENEKRRIRKQCRLRIRKVMHFEFKKKTGMDINLSTL